MFRQEISSLTEKYLDCRSKTEKMQMTKDIVAIICKDHDARFLKLEGGVWVEISNQAARDKVSHALRFAASRALKEKPKALTKKKEKRRKIQQRELPPHQKRPSFSESSDDMTPPRLPSLAKQVSSDDPLQKTEASTKASNSEDGVFEDDVFELLVPTTEGDDERLCITKRNITSKKEIVALSSQQAEQVSMDDGIPSKIQSEEISQVVPPGHLSYPDRPSLTAEQELDSMSISLETISDHVSDNLSEAGFAYFDEGDIDLLTPFLSPLDVALEVTTG